nr:hypothetical protein [Tanacetum cinerariifolium]
MVGQYVQRKEEEKQIEEEQAAKAQNWKLPVCYDDDDDEKRSISLKDNIISGLPLYVAITPISSTEEPDNSLKEISSGSTTTRSGISLLEYEAFYNDHVKEISSGNTITHSYSSLYDSFIFDLSVNPFPPADRSNFYELADELTHIISLPEYDCFYFKIEPNSGDFTMDVVEDTFPTREPRVHNALPTHPTLQLNLNFILSSESLFSLIIPENVKTHAEGFCPPVFISSASLGNHLVDERLLLPPKQTTPEVDKNSCTRLLMDLLTQKGYTDERDDIINIVSHSKHSSLDTRINPFNEDETVALKRRSRLIKEHDIKHGEGDEHLNTIPATKSDEFINSCVENLVPNLSESKGKNGCDMFACFTTFSNVLFDAEYEFNYVDDQSCSDEDVPEKIFSNPLFEEEIISMKIDPHHFNAESDLIESTLNRDSSIVSSSLKIDSFLDEFVGELTLLKSIPPGIDETDCDPEEEIRLTKRLLYDNSSPRPPEEFVLENSNADIEYFSPSPIPVEDKLLDNYSLSLLINESFHFDIPSFFRPSAKPPDGNTGILNIKMMGDNSDQKIEADDQAIHTILLDLPKDIYAVVDSCETAQEIWLRVQQMMKGSDIGIQEKKAKLFNEWEMFTSNEGESIESYYHRFLKLKNDLKRNKHFPEKIASNLKFLNNLQPEWSRHVTIVHQTKDLHTADYTQLYEFLKYNQKERISSNPHNMQIAQPGMNMGQDRQIQMVGGNGGNQFRQYAAGYLNGYNAVQNVRNQNQIGNGNLVAVHAEENAAGHNGNQIRCYNYRGIGYFARDCTVRPRRRDAAYLQTQLLIAQKEEA